MILLRYTQTEEGYTLHLDGDPSKSVKVKTDPVRDYLNTSPYTLVRMTMVITGKPFPEVEKEGVRVLYPDGTVAMDTTV